MRSFFLYARGGQTNQAAENQLSTGTIHKLDLFIASLMFPLSPPPLKNYIQINVEDRYG